MKMLCGKIYVLLLLLVSANCSKTLAQVSDKYIININNGLPANHVYQIIKDKHGYLWITTTNGILKYNGYQLKSFGLADGMPTSDVWSLYEDRKGRVWNSSRANDIGYIYNDKYHKAYINYPDPYIYPRRITEDSAGIIFLTRHGKNGPGKFCYERNDTINAISLKFPFGHAFYIVDNNGGLLFFANKTIYRVLIEGKLFRYASIRNTDIFFSQYELSANRYMVFANWLFKYSKNSNDMLFMDIPGNRKVKLTLPGNERIYVEQVYDSVLYIIGNRSTYKYDRHLNILDSFLHTDIFGKQYTDQATHVFEDPFWGRIISTNNSGLFFYYNMQGRFVKRDSSVSCRYVGTLPDSTTCWWDKDKGTFLIKNIQNEKVLFSQNHPDKIVKLVKYTDDASILLSDNKLELLDHRTKKIEPLFTGYTVFKTIYSNNVVVSDHFSFLSGGIFKDCVLDKAGRVHAITLGFGYLIYRTIKDSVIAHEIDNSPVSHIVYDSLYDRTIAYGDKRIVCNGNGGIGTIVASMLNKLDIKKIESVIPDKYGNLFIKDYDKLILFNERVHVYQRILFNEQMNNSFVFVQDNILIAAGRFGVSFNEITGRGTIGASMLYANNKDLNYSRVDAAWIVHNEVQLSTDKGTYSVAIPAHLHPTPNAYAYNLVCNSKDSVRNLDKNDTVRVDQQSLLLRLDCIRPTGVGEVKHKYFIQSLDSSYHTSYSNELSFTSLLPGKYYKVFIITFDDVWQSEPLMIHVYVLPYWWQTVWGKTIIAIVIVLLLIALLYLAIRITQYRAHKKNQQLELKNKNLALELKSIHAQINPHFIFNTLSTGLFFIKNKKMTEAYDHIATFSDLLRAYINSSRNKFITLEQEVENLENYIKLQQNRFDNVFEYEIHFAADIIPAVTQIPSLLLQPLVENAIIHGLFHKEGKGLLRLLFDERDNGNELVCTIDDNGIGREQARIIRDSTSIKQSYGTELVNDLITIFNEHEHLNITINYHDKYPPLTGTTVTVIIKTVYND